MRRRLDDILNNLSDSIESGLDVGNTREYYGLTELVRNEDDQVRPIEKTQVGEGREISPDDSYSLQIYYRLLVSGREVDNERGFGAKPWTNQIYQVRLFGIGQMEDLENHDSDYIAGLVADVIPNRFNRAERLTITDINSNYIDIVSEEFAGQEIEHLLTDIIAFTIDFTINQIICS